MAKDIVKELRKVTVMTWDGDEIVDEIAERAATEIERLRADRDRWRAIADGFAEAGTHPTAYDIALEDYEEARCVLTNEQVDQMLKVIKETHRG